jgi:hypothetical protein
MIVCSRADFFARAIKFGGTVSSTATHASLINKGQEATRGKINLPEDEPVFIKLLVQYSYEGEHDPRLPDIPKTPKACGTDSSYKINASIANHPSGNQYNYAFPHTCCDYDFYRCSRIYSHHVRGQDCNTRGLGTKVIPKCYNFVCDACKVPA